MYLKPIKSNMTELELNETRILFSYNTPVACHVIGKGYLKTSKKWSNTTSKHINDWLRLNKAQSVQTVDQAVIENIVKLEESGGYPVYK